jgi:hypothetical protein
MLTTPLCLLSLDRLGYAPSARFPGFPPVLLSSVLKKNEVRKQFLKQMPM